MERESMEEGLINKFMSKDDIKINDVASSSVTPLLLFSAGLSGLAAFSNGCAFGYTSAAEAGIMEDLNLSIAQDRVVECRKQGDRLKPYTIKKTRSCES
ncbi:hypothetical protein DCAR_0623927 [Daucus carota subsp. sativus]|uniref:Uncharacterized protein n=1 Tax=Daucus carota subsp. sativus TaxID=79200 RepID=A0A164VI48_DAUCS|nr:hypothetical protein DCAR_0623927 [Daucus carota subsp. sativus]